MNIEDKYGIEEAIAGYFKGFAMAGILKKSYPGKCVSKIWSSLYMTLPFRDTDDKDPEKVIEIIKAITGNTNLHIEMSCGLFYHLKIKLDNGTWFLERCPGGYYILPMSRAGRRCLTRLDADMAADLIVTFDSCIPKILARAEEEQRKVQERMLVSEIIRTTVEEMVHGLQEQGMIEVPDIVCIRYIAEEKVNIHFGKAGMITSRLDSLEETLLNIFGIR